MKDLGAGVEPGSGSTIMSYGGTTVAALNCSYRNR
jgi:hypothetical protein